MTRRRLSVEIAAAALAFLALATGCAPTPPPAYRTVYEESFDQPAASGTVQDVYASKLNTIEEEGRNRYRNSNLSVHDGALDIHLRNNSGGYVTFDPSWRGHTYGRYSFTTQATGALRGYKLAVLLWPTSDRWPDGELDFPEGALADTAHLNHHTMTGCHTDRGYMYCDNVVSVDTHIPFTTRTRWEIIWRPESVTYKANGKLIRTIRSSVPKTSHRLVFQARPSRDDAGCCGHLLVDDVRIEQPTGQSAAQNDDGG